MTAVDVGSEGLSRWREVTLQEVMDQYDIVGAETGNSVLQDGAYIIVAERGNATTVKLAQEVDLRELGYTSMSPWTAWTREETLPELRDKLGVRKWYDLKRNDGTVRGGLKLVKTPILSAHWYLEPGDDTILSRNIKDFVSDCLFDDLNVDWSQVLGDVLLMYDYGYMVLEKVFKFRPDGKVGLRKLAPRHPLDIREWIHDSRGGPAGIIMEPFVPYGNVYGTSGTDITDPSNLGELIPIKKLAIFSLEPEGGDLRGISVLRSAYKHWYYKDTLYKIDAIQKERHGIGVPVIKLPPGFNDDDKKLADEIGRNLRTNERSHIVLPMNWEIMFAKLEGQPVDCIASIEHHDARIRDNILAPFMNDADPGEASMDMFFKSTRYVAFTIASIFNKFVIPDLVDKNFMRGKYPKLHGRRIGEWTDLRTLSFALRNFVGAGLITPDDVLEAQLRGETDLPKQDFATARVIYDAGEVDENGDPLQRATPPGGDANRPQRPTAPRVGLPRQRSTPPVGPPRGNAGRDVSGGQ